MWFSSQGAILCLIYGRNKMERIIWNMVARFDGKTIFT
jgi:hypothetical protein